MSTRRDHAIRRGTAATIAADKQKLQLELYDSIAALFLDPNEQTYTRVARFVSIARKAMALQQLTTYDTQIRSAQRALDEIFDRWEDTGEVRALDLEKRTLRAACPALSEAIDKASIRGLEIARDRTEAEMAVQGAKQVDHPFLERR
jgi:hypothetical protein